MTPELNGIVLPEEGNETGGWLRRRVFLISTKEVLVVLEYRETLCEKWTTMELKRFKRDEVEAAVRCLSG